MKKIFTPLFLFSPVMIFICANSFSQNIVTVTDCNLNGWIKDQKGTTTVSFVNGPSIPPLGKGSFHIFAPDAGGKIGRLRNGQYSGLLLSAITELSFSTYIEQRSSMENPYSDAPFVVLQVDADGDNIAEFHLVFDPGSQSQPYVTNNVPDQGKTKTGAWQNWDMFHGGWFDGADDPQHGFPLFSLTSFIAQHPNARILNDVTQGGAAIRLSGGGPVSSGNFIGDIDNFRIGVRGVTTIYDFEFTIANAGADKNVIYGYGSNCTTLTGSASGGVAPYTYTWSGGSTPNNAYTEVCPTTSTAYTLTVTDVNGCTRTDDVMVNVNDVRCGNKMDKVKLCHNGNEICVAKEAVAAHLNHGDVLGSCSQEPAIKTNNSLEMETTELLPQFKLANYPNPFRGTTRIEYELPADGNVSLKVFDLAGREITTLVNGNKKQGKYFIDFAPARLSTGIYYYKIAVSSNAKVFTQTNMMIIDR